tara:strand:+ start:366 stop:575 length:210 start_codon:yes stop_codon:yes gene_type:complete
VDINTLVFGSMAVISLAAFLYLGRFKASSKQTDREDRINWSKGANPIFRYLWIGIIVIFIGALIFQFFK